ncbi:NAD-dependent DNA ligase LigA [Anaeromicropila herbilytica]|uniref:DNA ligase n=1 Tax=Anaeromicropila herbilytica TaxID=2785025 RepID=A0A7R7EMN8_9FIRM|nr:NAD-dependent DNA ligase LigA [Anaeromicropila herbilytica]BCN31691.1 DNA ligase [Anaeromicropila herbilytica]
MEDKLKLIKEKVDKLNEAGRAYYSESNEIMSNFEYDQLYDELVALEKETGIVLSNSPTINVGYEALSELPKERHLTPALSLDKTKSVEDLKDFLGSQKGLLSWKLDGLTVVLTYQHGELVKAVTRGNGEIGEVITNNAKVFKNIPLRIQYQGELVLRGEAMIKYSDFEKINAEIEDVTLKYKNPRNLCSGSVRQLNNGITAKRNVHFFAFSLVKADDVDFHNSRAEQYAWLQSQGFDVVESKEVTKETMDSTVEWFAKTIVTNDFPSDGLVILYDDIAYGRSLGTTSKFPKDSIAFKWQDEQKETVLKEIEWSASRTGLINPVAIFEPVELEGTTVARASVHNISIMEGLELGIGDTITVYKANMIIPQIADNLTRSGVKDIPEICPVCGGVTKIKQDNGVKALFCTNEECLAKKIKSFTHFVSRDAMNIDGLSEATIEKLIAKGLIKELADLFHVEKYKDEITKMEGFGEKSYQNLIASINEARKTTLPKFIYSLGIPNIGLSNAKLICKEFDNDINQLLKIETDDLVTIQGIGGVIAETFVAFFKKESNIAIVNDLLQEVEFEREEKSEEQIFAGMNFVITGSVEHYANRNEVKEVIEQKGGKVTGSVTSKTNYLINNDNTSNSSKNKKAKELQVPIITEEEFIQMLGE